MRRRGGQGRDTRAQPLKRLLVGGVGEAQSARKDAIVVGGEGRLSVTLGPPGGDVRATGLVLGSVAG
jgi:hypothetical protein